MSSMGAPAVQSLEMPSYYPSGTLGEAFDFSGKMRALIDDISRRSPEFAHLRVPQILVTITSARGPRSFGLQARVTPLRFARGELLRYRRGVPFQVQRYFANGTEFLYIVAFCLPRFLNQDFDDKLITIFHELYHIGEKFDGDLRRLEGRYQLHTHCQKEYDQRMAHFARAYLNSHPNPALLGFLRLNFDQLVHRHGAIRGVVVPRPRIIPLQHPRIAPLQTPQVQDSPKGPHGT